MDLYYHHNEKFITIGGNTYPHREVMKSLGAKFWGEQKLWVIPFSSENLMEVQKMCASPGSDSDQVSVAVDESNHGQVPATTLLQDKKDFITIRELVERVEGVISDTFSGSVWVVGEVQNLSFRKNAIYFDLAESSEKKSSQAAYTVGCILWKSQSRAICLRLGIEKIEDLISEDLKMRVQVKVQFYRARSQLSLQVVGIDDDYTKGNLALQREALLKELRLAKLDTKNKSTYFPPLPLKIGLVSAAGSRAETDFLDQLKVSGYPGEVIFCSASMQGDKTSVEVVQALTRLVKAGCSVVVITRGGGSAADLRWFDDREIAMAVCHASVPVIAAIGHHDDYCVAEEVCYLRQKTPTAAAEYIAGLVMRVRVSLDQTRNFLCNALSERCAQSETELVYLSQQLGNLAGARISEHSQALHNLVGYIEKMSLERLNRYENHLKKFSQYLLSHFMESFNQHQRTLLKTSDQVSRIANEQISSLQAQLSSLETQVVRHDPSGWLEKGWTRLENLNGVIRLVSQVVEGDSLRARLVDGSVDLVVKNICIKEKGIKNGTVK